jgi:hypothetical protein
VPYFHLVFTVPEELNVLALANPKWFYDLLFDSASKTLLEITADAKHLGAKIGVLAVLHTWSQTLLLHPHLHCIVPGAGPPAPGGRAVSCATGWLGWEAPSLSVSSWCLRFVLVVGTWEGCIFSGICGRIEETKSLSEGPMQTTDTSGKRRGRRNPSPSRRFWAELVVTRASCLRIDSP